MKTLCVPGLHRDIAHKFHSKLSRQANMKAILDQDSFVWITPTNGKNKSDIVDDVALVLGETYREALALAEHC